MLDPRQMPTMPDPSAEAASVSSHGDIAPEMIRMELATPEMAPEADLGDLEQGVGAPETPVWGSTQGQATINDTIADPLSMGQGDLATEAAEMGDRRGIPTGTTSSQTSAHETGTLSMPEGSLMADSQMTSKEMPSDYRVDPITGQELPDTSTSNGASLDQAGPLMGHNGSATAGANGDNVTLSDQADLGPTTGAMPNASHSASNGISTTESMQVAGDPTVVGSNYPSIANGEAGEAPPMVATHPEMTGSNGTMSGAATMASSTLITDSSAAGAQTAQSDSPPPLDQGLAALSGSSPTSDQPTGAFDAPAAGIEDLATAATVARDGTSTEARVSHSLDNSTAVARAAEPGRVDGPTGPTVGEGSPSPEAIERAERVLQQVRMQLRPDLRQATLELRPESLGRIAIQIEIEDGQTTAVIRADRAEALSVLERHLPELRSMFQQSGVDVSDLDVGLSSRHEGEADLGDAQNRQRGESGSAAAASETEQPIESALAAQFSDHGVDTYA